MKKHRMKRNRLVLYLASFLILLFPLSLHAQLPALNKDSISAEAESLLKRLKEEKQLDSLVKARLSAEAGSGSNQAKIRQMEAFIARINARDSARKAEQAEKVEELKKHSHGIPVAPFNDTLFMVYLSTGPFTAAMRASSLNNHLVALYEDPFFTSDSLKAVETGSGYDLVYKNTVIFSLTELDAMWVQQEVKLLAQDYLHLIREAVVLHKKEYGLYNQLKRILQVLGVLAALILLIKLLNKPLRALTYLLTRKIKTHQIRIRNTYVLSAAQYRKFVFKFVKVLRGVLRIICIYLALLLIFSIFPETKGWTGTLISWVLNPLKTAINGCISYLPKLFTIVVIYLLFRYSIRLLQYFVNEIEKGSITINGFHSDWAKPTFGIIKFLLYVFFFIIIFPYLPGSNSAAFQGVSVFIGVLLSLGSSSAISNIIAGLIITYMRPFKVGDRIRIGDSIGDVTEKTILVTRIRTIKNEEITVPNAQVLLNNTINYSSNTRPEDKGLILYTTITISYNVDAEKAERLLIEAALKTGGILRYPKPFVFHTALNDFNVSYQINAYTKNANLQDDIYSELIRNIHTDFTEAGIDIKSPSYTVFLNESPGNRQ